ncbi:hypothetical protein BO99DRAFT_468312 [Aspergillus violaceofuscus CBS 115571]|uniref:Uncharacterized protein n=1 Tax=Aspergillus violaceofuscus (strain CBS 115571) TaxID=1450538 RepID=A0A2V5IRQ5_ASPV1|nr:hypothetical protein BO99DRAFT_468312 [Aspergillus violaceofuscus CBS 115571]
MRRKSALSLLSLRNLLNLLSLWRRDIREKETERRTTDYSVPVTVCGLGYCVFNGDPKGNPRSQLLRKSDKILIVCTTTVKLYFASPKRLLAPPTGGSIAYTFISACIPKRALYQPRVTDTNKRGVSLAVYALPTSSRIEPGAQLGRSSTQS